MTTLAGRRIIFVLGSLELGGAERQAILLAERLAHDAGAEVQVWGFSEPEGRVAELCRVSGIACRHLPLSNRPWRGHRRHWLGQLGRLAWALRRARPDVLLPYYALPNLACGLVWRGTGAKLCVWNQRDEGIRAHPRLEAIAARLTPCFVANSPGGAKFLHETFALAPGKVHVVPNGVELPPPAADRAAWRSRLGLADDQLAACMIAHLHIFKDHATLLRAWRMVVDRRGNGPPPVLLLAGKPGDTADATGQLIAELQLQRHVRLLGPVDDVAGLLGAADLGVLSSLREGCPNAVLEYMAAGLPVIASDIDGVRMALGPAAAPWLAPTGNAAALAAQIAALLDDAGLRQQLGAANRQRAQIEFSPRQLLVRTLALLTAQLSSAARRAA